MMQYSVEIDQIDRTRWSRLLDEFNDANVYQTWAYGAANTCERGLSHAVLKIGDRIVALAQLRLFQPGRRLKYGIAYLRWGPLFDRRDGTDPSALGHFAEVLRKEYVCRRRMFLRVFPNAYRGTFRSRLFEQAFHNYTPEAFRPGETYRTLVLDLTVPLDEIRARFDSKWRNQLNRAEKEDLTLEQAHSHAHFEEFVALYRQMVARKRFAGVANMRTYLLMQNQLPDTQRLEVFLARQRGVPAAGLVCTAMGTNAIYLHGATNERGMACKAAYLLQWQAIRWLHARGVRTYDLGGINPESNPGVYLYKRRMGGEDVNYLFPFVSCDDVFSMCFNRGANILRSGIGRNFRRWFQQKVVARC